MYYVCETWKMLENVAKRSEFVYTREQRYTKVIYCYYTVILLVHCIELHDSFFVPMVTAQPHEFIICSWGITLLWVIIINNDGADNPVYSMIVSMSEA